MEYHELGKTECRISRLGFGCAPFSAHDYGRVDDSDLIRSVRRARDQGINFFDVADVYGFGRAERLLARALGSDRYDVVVATKCGLQWDHQGRVVRNGSPDYIRKSVEASLERLRLERIPLLQLHWPDPRTSLTETFEAMEDLRAKGQVQHLGICNLELDSLCDVVRDFRIQSIQFGYNLLCRSPSNELLEFCLQHGISALAHSSLARGFLSGKYATETTFDGSDTRNSSRYFSARDFDNKQRLIESVNEVARQRGRNCAATAIRWVLDEPRIGSALVGIKNPRQLQDNLAAIGWNLTAGEYSLLSRRSAECEGSLSGDLARKETRQAAH